MLLMTIVLISFGQQSVFGQAVPSTVGYRVAPAGGIRTLPVESFATRLRESKLRALTAVQASTAQDFSSRSDHPVARGVMPPITDKATSSGSDVVITNLVDWSNDPILSSTGDGVLFVSYVDTSATNGRFYLTKRSTDYGATWVSRQGFGYLNNSSATVRYGAMTSMGSLASPFAYAVMNTSNVSGTGYYMLGYMDTAYASAPIYIADGQRPALANDYVDFPSGAYIYLVYYSSGRDSLVFRRSQDYGNTWNTTLRKLSGSEVSAASLPLAKEACSIAYTSTGGKPYLHVIYTGYNSANGSVDLYYTYSMDYGSNWSPPQSFLTTSSGVNNDDLAPSIDARGNHVVFSFQPTTTGGQTGVGYFSSNDAGNNWTFGLLSATNGTEHGVNPSVSIEPDTCSAYFYVGYTRTLDGNDILYKISTSHPSDTLNLGSFNDQSPLALTSRLGLVSSVQADGSFGASLVWALIYGATDYDIYFDATSRSTPGGAPSSATTTSATGISGSGATLNGSVNANNLSTKVVFQYGTTHFDSTITAIQSPLSGATTTAVSASPNTLSGGTTYSFRTVASNVNGTRYSTNQSFATPASGNIVTFRVDMTKQRAIGAFRTGDSVKVLVFSPTIGRTAPAQGKVLGIAPSSGTDIYQDTLNFGNYTGPIEYKFWNSRTSFNTGYEGLVGSGSGGYGNRTYTVASGSYVLPKAFFNNDSSLAITSIAPLTGGVGSTVTVNGYRFNSVTTKSIVRFGGVKANIVSATASTLTVTVPTGAGYGPVAVTDTSTDRTAYSNASFAVTFPSSHTITSSSFASKVDSSTGTGPRGIVVGDFDGDGKNDVAVANYSANNVSVLRNNSSSGAISFPSKSTLTTGVNPINIAAGDLDGDGKLDLLVTNYTGNSISVFRNISTGAGNIAFAAKFDSSVGTHPYGVAIGDIDGDGRPDVVVSNIGSNSLSVYLNTSVPGAISFAPRVDVATGSSPYGVAIADMNGDGFPDVAITNWGSNTVSIFQNTSVPVIANLAAVTSPTTPGNPNFVAAGDLDGDNNVDLVTSNTGGNSISLFRSTSSAGGISFASRIDSSIGTIPFNVALGDVDGDGKPDIVSSNSGLNTISVFKNTSTSGLLAMNARVNVPTGSGPEFVVIADIDGDGKPDLISANFSANTVSVLRNTVSTGALTESEPNNNAAQANFMAYGDSVAGAISPINDVDYYKFSATAGDTVTLFSHDINTSALDGELWLYSSNGYLVASNDDYLDITASKVSARIDTTGTYYVRYASYYNTTTTFPNSVRSKLAGQSSQEGASLDTSRAERAKQQILAKKQLEARTTGIASSDTGAYRLSVTRFARSIPIIWFYGPDIVTKDSALIFFDFYPNGLPTSIVIQFGLTQSYSNTITLGSYTGLNDTYLFVQLSGLTPNSVYHYRFGVTNSAGPTVYSLDQIFTTLPVAPTNLSASPISSTQINLSWGAGAYGSPTRYRIFRSLNSSSGFTQIDSVDWTSTAYNNMGLTPNTTYYYRVYAVNDGGQSAASNQVSATTTAGTVTVPSAPTALSATAVSSSQINLSWTGSSTGSPTLYRIFRSATSGSGFSEIDSVAGTVTTYANSGLSATTTYYYLVYAVNAGGQSAASNQASATTQSSGLPTAIAVSSPATNWLTAYTYTIKWTSQNLSGNINIKLSINGGSTYSTTIASNASNTGSYSWVPTTQTISNNCILRVESSNNSGIFGLSNIFAIVNGTTLHSQQQTVVAATFPSNPTSNMSYRLISIPGNLSNVKVSQLNLNGTQGNDWKLFSEPGSSSANFIEMNSGSGLTTGQGYWFIKKDPLSIGTSYPTPASQDSDGTVRILLTGGTYSIIGNPFDKPVPWSSVLTINNLSSMKLYSWNDSWKDTSTYLQPGVGYYINSAGIASLKIPYAQFGFPSQIPPANPFKADWRLQLIFSTEVNKDDDNFIGIAKEASEGKDAFEYNKPPLVFNGSFLYMSRPDWDPENDLYYTDYRPAIGSGQTWKFEVTNPSQSFGTVTVDGVDQVPSQYQISLVNEETGVTVDLRRGDSMQYGYGRTTGHFMVVVGPQDYLTQQLAQYMPKDFKLEQNYPNPFNPSTIVTFELPKVAPVRVEVFSILGQRVKVLAEGEFEAGIHQAVWTGDNEHGSRVASGVYFCRLTAGDGFVQTTKMLLTK